MPISRPEVFDNGTMTWVDDDLMDKIWYGYSPLGWEGDPNMRLWYDNVDHRFYLTALADDGAEYVIMRSKPDVTLDSLNIIKMLVTHDRNRGYNMADDMDTNDAKIIESRQKKDAEQIDDVAQKLMWGIKKDIN